MKFHWFYVNNTGSGLWWIFFVIRRAAMFGKGTGVHQYTWQPGRYPAMGFHGDDWNFGHNRSQKMINIKALDQY